MPDPRVRYLESLTGTPVTFTHGDGTVQRGHVDKVIMDENGVINMRIAVEHEQVYATLAVSEDDHA